MATGSGHNGLEAENIPLLRLSWVISANCRLIFSLFVVRTRSFSSWRRESTNSRRRTPTSCVCATAVTTRRSKSWRRSSSRTWNCSRRKSRYVGRYRYIVTVLGPVYTSNNVEATGNIAEATFDFVEATFDFVATNGNNVERNFVLSTKSKQIEHVQFVSTLSKGQNFVRHWCRNRQQHSKFIFY